VVLATSAGHSQQEPGLIQDIYRGATE
jgi:hypothetical protein